MTQKTDLLINPQSVQKTAKTTPPPTANSCYRSRIYSSPININPLIAACDQLFSLVITLKELELPDDSSIFLQDLAHEIRSFEHHARIANYKEDVILKARYTLCYLIDKTIISTNWGKKNSWEQKNLLSLFFNETCNDEKFFSIANQSLKDTFSNLHLIELLYLCINIGLIDQYKEQEDKQKKLEDICNKLYRVISQHNYIEDKKLLISKSKDTIKKNKNDIKEKANYKKILKVGMLFALLASGFTYLLVNVKLINQSKQTASYIKQIKSENLI